MDLTTRYRRLEGRSDFSPENRRRVITFRELDVVRLICHGLTNQQIADLLYISQHSVARHIRSVSFKIGAADRLGLILYSVHNRLHL
jgi:DNA-binding NarL/FixJ family response regulator